MKRGECRGIKVLRENTDIGNMVGDEELMSLHCFVPLLSNS